MSWQLASYGMLALALGGGFAWYERTRPDARTVALVGTLAALAALGRIAFAAIPNVKPTTDIVLIAGYALGGGPGFVTGAVAALASNFFFGQGPWTPWQMAGWGITGLIGAGLAATTRRRIGRVRLAVVCGLVGFLFTMLQDFGDWVTYSDHSAAQLGVYLGKGIGFDFIHAGGCVVFALAFAPALLHSLSRFRMRLNVTWIATVLLALVMVPAAARAATTPAGYLLSAQNRDGGLGPAPGQPSSTLFSGWAALGLEASGIYPSGVLAYIERDPGGDPGSLERSILALSAARIEPGGLLAHLRLDLRSDGSVADQTNLTAFAILALRAAGRPPGSRTYRWLIAQHDGDGGFNFATGSHTATSDVDDTGGVLEALAGHAPAGELRGALHYLLEQQNRDGGFPAQPGAASNAQSTAFAVQGLLAAAAAAAAPVAGDSGAAAAAARGQAYLRSLIRADGHVAYARGQDQTPVWVTAEAELALAGKPLPLAPLPLPRSAPSRRASPKPPARAHRHTPAPPHAVHAIHHTRPRRHRVRAAAPPVRLSPARLQTLASDAGILAALALAPVDNP